MIEIPDMELMDVDYAYHLYKDNIERNFHFHHYDSGMITYKKQYKHLYYIIPKLK